MLYYRALSWWLIVLYVGVFNLVEAILSITSQLTLQRRASLIHIHNRIRTLYPFVHSVSIWGIHALVALVCITFVHLRLVCPNNWYNKLAITWLELLVFIAAVLQKHMSIWWDWVFRFIILLILILLVLIYLSVLFDVIVYFYHFMVVITKGQEYMCVFISWFKIRACRSMIYTISSWNIWKLVFLLSNHDLFDIIYLLFLIKIITVTRHCPSSFKYKLIIWVRFYIFY